MSSEADTRANVRQAVPFFAVADMERSIRFYVNGLDCRMTKKWEDQGKLRWCWLEIGEAALMLQEFPKEGHDSWTPQGKVGIGVTISFQCVDALEIYRDCRQNGLTASVPFVGNQMWVTAILDPDGYRLEFESPTDIPEGTRYTEPQN